MRTLKERGNPVSNIQTLDASLSNFQNIDDNFSTGSVKVMYVGRNRNGSFFSKESVERAMASLKNMPVVGEWSDEKNDYKSHGGKVILTEDEIKMIPTTRPYGVIPESFTYEWAQEDIGEGRMKETLIIHNVIIWTAHYEEAFNVLLKNSNQSMEIEVVEADWDEELEIFNIKEFKFLALCILGEDVEPAFENAKFFSLDKDSFVKEFSKMMEELNYSLSEQSNKEVKKLTKKKEKDLEPKDNFQEPEVEPVKPVDEPVVNPVDPIVEPAELITEPETPVAKDEPAEPEAPQEPVTPVEPPAIQEPDVPEDEPVDFEARVTELETELATLKGEFESLEAEKKDLAEFKLAKEKESHESEATQLFAKMQLTDEDTKELDVHAFSLKELEDKCYAILGRKLAEGKQFSLENTEEITKVKVPMTKQAQSGNIYQELVEKYGNK